MRSLSLIILLTIVFTLAAEPPPPPRMMNINMIDGTCESIACSRIDQLEGVTFPQNGMKMFVRLSDPNPYSPELPPIKSTKYYTMSLVSNITFSVIE